jgi:hypothetical protein
MLTPRRDLDEFLAIRKAEGLKIDPRTAEVAWVYAETFDPYGLHIVPDELSMVGREYFARDPGSDIWVRFEDLPENTQGALWQAHKQDLVFPAGLPVDQRPVAGDLLRASCGASTKPFWIRGEAAELEMLKVFKRMIGAL